MRQPSRRPRAALRSLTVLALLAMTAVLFVACSDEPVPDSTPAEPAQRDTTQPGPTWLTSRPDNAYAYAAETLVRFRKLVDGDTWRDAAWNAQGTLEAHHRKTGLTFVLIPAGSF